MFGTIVDVVGRTITVDSDPGTVVGVVREGSPIAFDSYAQIFLLNPMLPPVYARDELEKTQGFENAHFRLKQGYEIEDLQKQVNQIADRILRVDTAYHPYVGKYSEFWFGPFESTLQNALGPLVEQKTWPNIIKQHMWVLMVLLIIPAINISGMIGAQMERKASEIGIRRCFGATKTSITRQLLLENLYLTLIGGVLGLILSWTVIYSAQGWLFELLDNSRDSMIGVSKNLSSDMLFAPGVFFITLLVCVILNMASAYIPVRMILRKQVVDHMIDNK